MIFAFICLIAAFLLFVIGLLYEIKKRKKEKEEQQRLKEEAEQEALRKKNEIINFPLEKHLIELNKWCDQVKINHDIDLKSHKFLLDIKENSGKYIEKSGDKIFLCSKSLAELLKIRANSNKEDEILTNFNYHLIDILVQEKYKETTFYTQEDFLYWEVEGEVISHTETVENPLNKPSKLSLSLTEQLWGTAAAINKANQGISTRIVTQDNRKIFFFFTSNKENIKHEVAYKYYDKVSIHFAEKRFMFTAKSVQTDESNSLLKIREIKQLLDEGIITQEEFEQKKKDLLGL